ncbi:hypothetical protein DY000_02011260 [Brassica cretica]|uniref:Uncharacterized protein n=1 Tax=Brassica cretica TaxID=69181 RepID=A0ABQ7CW84_BRACR|nr:hypothetical protein DY000_02011260 [Brassica cretica]
MLGRRHASDPASALLSFWILSKMQNFWTLCSRRGRIKEEDQTKKIAVEKVMIDESNPAEYAGKPVFHAEKIYEPTPVGVVMGS